jgi:hypothetical protein
MEAPSACGLVRGLRRRHHQRARSSQVSRSDRRRGRHRRAGVPVRRAGSHSPRSPCPPVPTMFPLRPARDGHRSPRNGPIPHGHQPRWGSGGRLLVIGSVVQVHAGEPVKTGASRERSRRPLGLAVGVVLRRPRRRAGRVLGHRGVSRGLVRCSRLVGYLPGRRVGALRRVAVWMTGSGVVSFRRRRVAPALRPRVVGTTAATPAPTSFKTPAPGMARKSSG